jgi:hypothetical protein
VPTQPEAQFQPVVNSCETATDAATATVADEPVTVQTATADTADFTGTAAFGSEHEESL